jgi:hypothetical protein
MGDAQGHGPAVSKGASQSSTLQECCSLAACTCATELPYALGDTTRQTHGDCSRSVHHSRRCQSPWGHHETDTWGLQSGYGQASHLVCWRRHYPQESGTRLRFEREEERKRLYEAVYESDHWKHSMAPQVSDMLFREQGKARRLWVVLWALFLPQADCLEHKAVWI